MRGEFSDLSFASRHRIKEVARYVYLRSFYSRVDRFCYIGEGARQHLSRHGVPSHRMFFSPYSVDDELIKQQIHAGSRDEARAKLGLQGDTFSFLLSGKLIDRKNPFAILEALRMVRSPRETALIVLGDGELKEPFVAKGRELLGDRLIFAGFVNQSQLGSYYAAADALVMPSQYETWGLVVNEAMHYGVPVIVSSQVGCAPDLVEQGRTGYVYRHGDIGQLAAFMQLLVDDPEAARIKGRAARERVARYVVRESTAGIVRALGLEASKPGFTERTAACAQQA